MHKLSFLACAALAAGTLAQSPLNTLTGGTNNGNSGGGLYFDLQVNTTVTFTQFDVRCGPAPTATTAGNTPLTGTSILEIWLGPTTYVGNVTNPALWTIVGTGTGTVGPNLVANFVLNSPFALAPGNYGVALKSLATATGGNAQWGFGYTNGVTCTNNTTPGVCANSLFTNNELTIRAGAAQNAFLSGGIFQPRIYNGAIHYTPGGTPVAIAAWENYGTGCVKSRSSFFEFHPNSIGFDLSGATGSTLSLALGGGNYAVTASGTPYTPPTAAAIPVVLTQTTGNETVLASTVLGAPLSVPILYPAGGTIQVATDLEICTDGYVTPVPGTNPRAAPTVAGFLNGAPRWAPYWKDVNPSTAGSMKVELDVVTGTLVVTWEGVADPGNATTTSSFQIAFLQTGVVEYRYAPNMNTSGGGSFPVLVGWTPGGGALENDIDISVAAAGAGFTTAQFDNAELTQVMNNRPRLGTTPSFTTTNAPAGTLFGVSMMSFTQFAGGLPLGGFGAPNCFQYQGAEVTQAIFSIAGGQFQQAFPIPNAISFNGLLVFAQSAAFAPGQNQLGVVFSNGTRMLIGSL